MMPCYLRPPSSRQQIKSRFKQSNVITPTPEPSGQLDLHSPLKFLQYLYPNKRIKQNEKKNVFLHCERKKNCSPPCPGKNICASAKMTMTVIAIKIL